MARSVNRVELIGNLGNDPEVRTFSSGGQVVNLSVATTFSYRDKVSGDMIDKTEWHRVNAYNKLAEICGRYLRKGSRVYIEGALQTRSWEQDGQRRYSTEINCRELMMLDDRNREQKAAENRGSSKGLDQPPAKQFSNLNDIDDDIPF